MRPNLYFSDQPACSTCVSQLYTFVCKLNKGNATLSANTLAICLFAARYSFTISIATTLFLFTAFLSRDYRFSLAILPPASTRAFRLFMPLVLVSCLFSTWTALYGFSHAPRRFCPRGRHGHRRWSWGNKADVSPIIDQLKLFPKRDTVDSLPDTWTAINKEDSRQARVMHCSLDDEKFSKGLPWDFL